MTQSKTYNPKYEALVKERLSAIINNNNSPILPFIDKKAALSFINSSHDYGKPWFGQLMCGVQLMAYIIQMNYWLEKYKPTIKL